MKMGNRVKLGIREVWRVYSKNLGTGVVLIQRNNRARNYFASVICQAQRSRKEEHLKGGKFLLITHGGAEEVTRAQKILQGTGALEVTHHAETGA